MQVDAYQLGRAFPGMTWLQWNGRFRDDVRRYMRGDPDMVGTMMQRVYGSDDLFPDTILEARHPYQSVNYVTCHDGPTLYDLVSYNSATGWNCGHEGDAGVPADVMELRKRQMKKPVLRAPALQRHPHAARRR